MMYAKFIIILVMALVTNSGELHSKQMGMENVSNASIYNRVGTKFEMVSFIQLDETSIEEYAEINVSLPRYALVCSDTFVYSDPFMLGDPLYMVNSGDNVRVRDRSHGTEQGWIMIKPAEWIPMNTLCGW